MPIDTNLQKVEQDLSQSRVLYEQVVIDNEPTQQQVIDRAEQLQIDDLVLAKQSLTKALEPFWRPYMNRFGDVYYVSLKDRKAYVEHPVDMETKILYAKRRKVRVPVFRAYELEDVSSSVGLIEEEIVKWKRSELLRSTQTIPSQLNIVYEESEQSNTERNRSQQSEPFQSSDDEYIQNLQKSQEENTRSRKSTPREQKQSFNHEYKKFPTSKNTQKNIQINFLEPQDEEEDELQLTPQYEKMLLEYQMQLRRQHQKDISEYRQKKQQNLMKKEEIFNQAIKSKVQQQKFAILADYQSEIQEKNSQKFQKQRLKLILQQKQKLQEFQTTLQKQKLILQKVSNLSQAKQQFISSLQQKMQHRINQSKYLMSQNINKSLQKTFYSPKIVEMTKETEEQFKKDSFRIMNNKVGEVLREKGIRERGGNNESEKVYPSSLTGFYENIVKKQLEKIDRMLVDNSVSLEIRKRPRSIFGSSRPNKNKENTVHDKQNKFNSINNQSKSSKPFPKYQTPTQIQASILKSSQQNTKFYQRRNKIFGLKEDLNQKNANNLTVDSQNNVTAQVKEQKQKILLKYETKPSSFNGVDRKSMYLRMMKRIL